MIKKIYKPLYDAEEVIDLVERKEKYKKMWEEFEKTKFLKEKEEK